MQRHLAFGARCHSRQGVPQAGSGVGHPLPRGVAQGAAGGQVAIQVPHGGVPVWHGITQLAGAEARRQQQQAALASATLMILTGLQCLTQRLRAPRGGKQGGRGNGRIGIACRGWGISRQCGGGGGSCCARRSPSAAAQCVLQAALLVLHGQACRRGRCMAVMCGARAHTRAACWLQVQAA